jgi:hypothetical protein
MEATGYSRWFLRGIAHPYLEPQLCQQSLEIALNVSADSQDTTAMNNRSVPTAIMLPHLVYRNVAEACEWLTRVFGFAEYYRHGQPVSGIQMYFGDAYIMLTGP